ncbi:MAG: PTS sugar transporter subunit IIA [Planctomycetaceae bacterium]
MSHEVFSLDELARHLGRDRRELEKLVQRGRIPGRKVGGEWQFHQQEITHWLEREMREYSERELAVVERSQRSEELDPDIPITSLLTLETVQVPLEARTKRSVLESLVEVAGRTWHVWEPATVLAAVQEREEIFSTAFENGLAIPHPRNPLSDALGESVIAFGRTQSGIPFGGTRGKLTDLFFLVLCRDSRTHLQVLARLGRMIQLPEFLDKLRAAPDSQTAYDVICQADETVGQSG